MFKGFWGFVFAFCLFSSAAFAAPVKINKMEGTIGGLWHAYGPTTINYKGVERMWIGGWAVQADQGDDLIYYSEKNSKGWTKPVLAFKKPNYAINDPTVIKHPVQDWLFMYYTGLHKDNQNAEGLHHNALVGFASSIDGGKSWTDHGIIIGQDNGFNKHGAWAPSAILSPNKKEIWLYYHTNSPSNILLRTRLDINGWKQIGKTQQVKFPGEALQHGRVNIDVAVSDGVYHMVTNEMSLSNIGYYRSTNGMSFTRANVDNPIMKGGANWILTPHLRVVDKKTIDVYFGFGHPNACTTWWHTRGVTDVLCSDSIHRWTVGLP